MSQRASEALSVLLADCDGAGALERVLPSWSSALEKIGRDYEIVLLHGGSEATRRLLFGADGKTGLSGRIPHLRALDQPEPRGLGASLRVGLAAVRFPLVLYAGCHRNCDTAAFREMLKRIDDADPETGRQIDLVNGFRAGWPLTGWRKHADTVWRMVLRIALGMHVQPRPGRLGGAALRYAWLLRFLFGLRIGDVDSRFKLFRKRIFERIPIQSDGEFVHAEILAKANFLGCLMDEVPIAEPAGPAQPAPPSRWRELRRVFVNPDFGPARISPQANQPV